MMDGDKLHQPDDEFTAVDDTMMSGNSPYQPTTDPVPHRRAFVGGLILEMRFMKSIAGESSNIAFLVIMMIVISILYQQFKFKLDIIWVVKYVDS